MPPPPTSCLWPHLDPLQPVAPKSGVEKLKGRPESGGLEFSASSLSVS